MDAQETRIAGDIGRFAVKACSELRDEHSLLSAIALLKQQGLIPWNYDLSDGVLVAAPKEPK